ncbi:hypothetical protein [Chitinibacter sp. GC72]|uniref:protein MIGRI n=1 Tax=Chitinibacter sp. GC72 TaxID=1526917 RepID=UPI0012FC2919|nr:hypothetical protein [Chitinibacter sp. GC72]
MNGKINQVLAFALLTLLLWQLIGAQRRQQLRRYSKIAAVSLLISAVVAVILHLR